MLGEGQSGNYPVVQWLRLHPFTAEGSGSIPGRVAKIPQEKRKNLKKGAEGAVFSELLECCLLGSESLTFPLHKVTVLSDFKKGRAERRSLGYLSSCSLHPNNRCIMFHGWSGWGLAADRSFAGLCWVLSCIFCKWATGLLLGWISESQVFLRVIILHVMTHPPSPVYVALF